MSSIQYRSKILIREGNPYVLVSPRRAASLKKGWKKPMPVLVQIDGEPEPPWRINMMPAGNGSFYLYLHGDVRKASGTKVGDTVLVQARFDEKYRNGPMHPMPSWFRSALAKNQAARKSWDALIPSRKKEILRMFSRLKSDEAKKRNLEKALRVLSGHKERFMARSWADGK